jgi:ATP-dependent DNA helicase RecG
MFRAELAELLLYGESSGIEFKRDDVHPQSLAKELCALANFQGGRVLLGVENDGRVSGLLRSPKDAEEWVMNLCRENLQPPLIPFWETVQWDEGKVVGVVGVPRDAPDKPYRARQGGNWVTFIRVGTTSRQATREEEGRLFQAAGQMRFELRPVLGATLSDLDLRRLLQYFGEVRGQETPAAEDLAGWERLLVNTEFMVEEMGRAIPTTGGLLLFGRNPRRFLPQAGITAVAYPGTEKDYAAIERPPVLSAPLVPLRGPHGLVESSLIDTALDFVRRNIRHWATLRGGERVDHSDFPEEAVREAIVNAVVHRDYTIAGTDVELSLYTDRLEIISPGRLPNTITVERMKAGCRYARNELLKDVLRDYRYIEHSGLGVPRKIIKLMREQNGTEPDLVEEEARFIVRLWKRRPPTEGSAAPAMGSESSE